jgi:hypothetical protein
MVVFLVCVLALGLSMVSASVCRGILACATSMCRAMSRSQSRCGREFVPPQPVDGV